jgi:hypothetical protein
MNGVSRWLQRLAYRLAGLKPGRYVMLIEVTADGAQWLISPAGDWENDQ